LRIAVLEDDSAQAELLLTWLVDAEHDCHHFETGRAFLQAMRHDTFDLAILDWGLPDIPGDQVLVDLREHLDWHLPVLFITSRDQEQDVVHALERGADDYMAKPVKKAETLARIKALARRSQPLDQSRGKLLCDPFRIDLGIREITRQGERVDLTQKEFELALFLFRNVGRLLSRGHILESVWGTRPDLNTRTVDTHISRIRNKLGITPVIGWRLSSIYQHGYRLEQASLDPDNRA
jgi:DNA-binding response OmpR family regulator